MPVAPEPTPAERNEDGDETPLPYLELGLVEVDFLHGRDNANAVT
jgi:hypothetical protein